LFELMRAERVGLAQYVNGFEQAGFTRSILTDDKVEMRIEVERGTTQVSEIRQTNLTDCHQRLALSYKRVPISASA